MNKNEHIELTSWVHDELKSQILDHRLKAGQKIIQEDVAQELGVSRTPLLKALQMLETEYLVESVPRRGYFVREISTKELIDIFEYREVLDGLATRLVADRAKDSDIKTIKECFTPFINQDGRINEKKYEKADQQFHYLIKEKCGNSIVSRVEMLGNIHVLAYQRGLLRPPKETLPEHMEIIKALEDRDPDKAEEVMRMHIRRSRESLLIKLDKSN